MNRVDAVTELRALAERVQTIAREAVAGAHAPRALPEATRAAHERRVASVEEGAQSCAFVLRALTQRLERLHAEPLEDRRAS